MVADPLTNHIVTGLGLHSFYIYDVSIDDIWILVWINEISYLRFYTCVIIEFIHSMIYGYWYSTSCVSLDSDILSSNKFERIVIK